MASDFPSAVSAVQSGKSDSSAAAKELLSQLTDNEKLSLLDGDTPFWPGFHSIMTEGYIVKEPYVFGEVSRLSIPGIRFTDGPRGINLNNSTCFPVSMARGASWDVALEEAIGEAIGREGRSQGANLFGGVCVNLPRHPAWGRAQETYGDDPIILGEMGAAITRGVQKHLLATLKHYALNSMENARFQVDVTIDEDVLMECFLPHFRRIVEEDCLAVMSAYNSVNGEWAGQNTELLTRTLRQRWGFKWLVMSDFIFGLRDPATSLRAGLDIEAPFAQQRADKERGLAKALNDGKINQEHIDRAGVRILAAQIEHYARRESAEPDRDVVFCQQHRDLARQAAARSAVLLKNDGALLPLSPSKTSKIALVGRLANTPNTGDQGSSIVRAPSVVTPYEGIKAAFPESTISLSASSSDTVTASKLASAADIAIVIVGYTAADEGEYLVPVTGSNPALLDLFPPNDGSEAYKAIGTKMGDMGSIWQSTDETGGDRASLRLPAADVALIEATAAANPKTIVCITTAGAVVVSPWSTTIPALIISWYGGSEGGHGLADMLTGTTDASGRLPYAMPSSEDHTPFFDRDAKHITYDRWWGQRLLDKTNSPAAFPLGWGLSFATFQTANFAATPHAAPSSESLKISLTLTNTSSRKGRHVLQVYGVLDPATDPEAHNYPHRVLLGFKPVDLDAGESRAVQFDASLRPLQRWRRDRENDADLGRFELPRGFSVELARYSGDPEAAVAGPF
jgi:beta-glucosidase